MVKYEEQTFLMLTDYSRYFYVSGDFILYLKTEKDNINKNENIQKAKVRGYEQNFINNM